MQKHLINKQAGKKQKVKRLLPLWLFHGTEIRHNPYCLKKKRKKAEVYFYFMFVVTLCCNIGRLFLKQYWEDPCADDVISPETDNPKTTMYVICWIIKNMRKSRSIYL